MHERKTITGNSIDDIWHHIGTDLNEDLLEYNILIKQDGKDITLDIDIDFGGGFEGGYAETAIVSPLNDSVSFRFTIHKEGLSDEVGKFFGMQDVKVGHSLFDERIIVKANNETLVKSLFTDDTIRSAFLSLEDHFTFGTNTHDHKKVLEFSTNIGITDPIVLRSIYEAFYKVLIALDELNGK